MTKEEMLNLKLYECNRKQCGDKCSNERSGCHLTSKVEYAVDPEQSVGYDYFVAKQLDSCLSGIKAEYLDCLLNHPHYPEKTEYMLSILENLLYEDTKRNIEAVRKRAEDET